MREFSVSNSPSIEGGSECDTRQDTVADCGICRGPEIYGDLLQLIDAEYWHVEVNPTNQQLIGRTLVGLKRHIYRIGDLTRDEVLEHHEIVSKLDVAARRAFGASMINLLVLMNGCS